MGKFKLALDQEGAFEGMKRQFQFGVHSPQVNAILEFLDNSVEARNRGGRHTTYINMDISPTSITVIDYGGNGATENDLITSLTMAGSREHKPGGTIGVSNLGSKLAASFLGTSLSIVCKAEDEGVYHRVDIPELRIGEVEFDVQSLSSYGNLDPSKGYFQIKVGGIREPAVLMEAVKRLPRVVSEEFRPILTLGDAQRNDPGREIIVPEDIASKSAIRTVEYDMIRINYSTKGNRSTPIEGLYIPLSREYGVNWGEQTPRPLWISSTECIWYWAGVLDHSDPRSRAIRNGIRFYFDGKLFKTSTLGLELGSDSPLHGLVGEVYLDNLGERIRKTFSSIKAEGIAEGSGVWRDELVPIVKERLEELTGVMKQRATRRRKQEAPDFLKKSFEEVNGMVNSCMDALIEAGIITSDMVGILQGGVVKGQRNPGPSIDGGRPKPEPIKQGVPWKDQDEITELPEGANTRIPRKRKSRNRSWVASDVEYEELPDRAQVSVISESESGLRKLKLNSNNPAVEWAVANRDEKRLMIDENAHHIASNLAGDDLETYLAMRSIIRLTLMDSFQGTMEAEETANAAQTKAADLRMARRASGQ